MSGMRVIVTGGSSGIGFACAMRLLQEGAHVGILDLRETDELLALREEFPERLAIRTADVSRVAQAREAMGGLREELGSVTGLVCAAGILSGRSLRDTSMEHWRKVFAVNVEGTVNCIQCVMDEMLSRESGAIVIVASQLVNGGGRNNAAYIASKSALVGLTRTAALEFAPHKVRINAVLPGVVDTAMSRNNASRQEDPIAHRERLRARHPLGRIAKPEEIAEGILYLLSDKSSFMTGAELLLDGGWSVA